jgi:hypothetical protein
MFAAFLHKQLIEDAFELQASEQTRLLLEQFFDSFIAQFEDSKECREYFASPINPELFFTEDRNRLDERLVKSVIEDEVELRFFTRLFHVLNRQYMNLIEQYSNEYLQNLELVKFLTRSKLMKYLFVYSSFLSAGDVQQGAPRGILWQTKTLIGKLLTPNALPLRKFKPQQNQAGKNKIFITTYLTVLLTLVFFTRIHKISHFFTKSFFYRYG